MCKKQTSVSLRSTECVIISLDAGLRMDGLPALNLWDVVIEVLRPSRTNKKPSVTVPGNGNEVPTVFHPNRNRKVIQQFLETGTTLVLKNCLKWIMCPATHSLLKGIPSFSSSRTMKLWSRWSSKAGVLPWDTCQEPTELLLIGCLIESIMIPKSNSDMLTPRTNSQDILIKGCFSKGERNHLLRLLNIMNLSCSPAAISVTLFQILPGIRNLCRREDRSRSLVKVLQWVLKPRLMSPKHPEVWCRKCLTCSKRWSERSSSATGLSNPEIPGKYWHKCLMLTDSSGKPFEHDRDTSDNVKHSQVRKQENVQDAQTLETSKGLLPSDRQASGNGQAMQWTRLTQLKGISRNMRITWSHSKIFEDLQIRTQEGHESFSDPSIERPT